MVAKAAKAMIRVFHRSCQTIWMTSSVELVSKSGCKPSSYKVLGRLALVTSLDSGRLAVSSSVVIFTGQLLKSLSLGLRDQQRGTTANKHEEGINLKDVILPRRRICLCSSVSSERSNGSLPDDRPNLAARSRNAMRGRTVSSRKDFTWHNESRCVGTWFQWLDVSLLIYC